VTPAASAAPPTAAATAGTTRRSKIEGTTYSSEGWSAATTPAIAWAAASFISSVTALARLSSSPRKNPGKTSALLIWLG
jgi:outer membrane PBP1 activator LpoA protein